MNQPLYLHFLDRELVEAAGAELQPSTLERSLAALTLGTDAGLYCGISVIWEHTLLSDASRRILAMLVAGGAIRPISYSATVEEFFESRIQLYRHDAARYPLYFHNGIDAVRSILPTDYKAERTTDYLQERLGGWSLSKASQGSEAERIARTNALQALTRRDSEAITFAFFAPFMRKSGVQSFEAESILSRQISAQYAGHYLKFSDGDIPTGVDGLGYFDQVLATNFPMYDVPLLKNILSASGFTALLRTPMLQRLDDWQLLLELRGSGVHARMVSLVRLLVWIACRSVEGSAGASNTFAIRHKVWEFARRYLHSPNEGRGNDAVLARLDSAEQALLATIGRLSRVPALTSDVELGRQLLLDYGADVLIVTATRVEARAVIDTLTADHGSVARPHFIGDKTYFDLGTISGARVYLTQTEMGSGGPSGSILTIVDAISALGPASVVMVGIAFGIDEHSQQIGDVLISRQVASYDLQRVGTQSGRRKIVLRGDRTTASPRLLDRCRAAALDWNHCPVHFGLVMSGDKLVDNLRFRDELVRLAGGEAVGGEMEGAGLYASAHRRKVDWILIKGICDWADGNKDMMIAERQLNAAMNAARFTSHLLGKGGFA
ncbi:5'-methylthioadenosine/S-adenosylhomocysteine nucleosidase family protein [Asanoa iriomotensis]|uniref:Nucleoside phosphorylase domain-containing protein n=1 Tax=Asanoa iriomotensis TaxID=234613 RepID=A0ABQ4BXJ7_9ACTN|nr:hypothetical protein [Asanoa iriomotensis]GIF55261.1 hypothetical protein Air01nite_13560 [Asanoa iriomotensis]